MYKIFISLLWFFLLFPGLGQARQYEVFDAQFYNGLYYPRIDIIEWGEQDGELPHLEFHIYSKNKPVEITGLPGESNGKPVLWLMYDLKFRSEKICRKVVAPAHFKEGIPLLTYKDTSNSEYDTIYFSTQVLKGKNLVPYVQQPYMPCSDEQASNKPGTEPTAPSTERIPASNSAPAPAAVDGKKTGKGLGIDYENSAVPFSF